MIVIDELSSFKFQSTHPVRGATAKYSKIHEFVPIFSKIGIHYFWQSCLKGLNSWQTK